MKLSVSAYRAHASAHKKILSSAYHSQLNYGSTGAAQTGPSSSSSFSGLYEPPQCVEADGNFTILPKKMDNPDQINDTMILSPTFTSSSTQEANFSSQRHHSNDDHDDNNSQSVSSHTKSSSQRTKSNQRWMKLRTTVQISSAIQKKPTLKREDSFLKRFSTRQVSETQETIEDTGSESASGDVDKTTNRRRRYLQKRKSVVNPDENFYFYWLMLLTICVLYNLWALIVRQSFPELQNAVPTFWCLCDVITDTVFIFDVIVQLRTGYLEQGLMVYNDKKLACHYVHSRDFILDILSLVPLDLLQLKMGTQPLLRFTRFFKVYRSIRFYYIVESRTVWPNLWRVVNLIHILLILAHWFGCFYYLLSEAEGFQGDWVYPYRPGDYATLTRKYLGSLYWSTLTLTTIGDLPTPETNAEPNFSVDGPRSIPRRGIKSRLLQFGSSYGYIFTIVSYLIGVFIFATIVGQVGNVITNRNANRLEFERLLDGAKTYMRHHKVPGGMKRRVLRWYDYSWSRGRIQGGGDINTALGLLPDKLKTELALHVNLSVLKKVTIFQECQPEFLHDLVLKMKAYIFTPGDSICRKGEVAREMFIIADGILEVLSETGKVLTTMKAGDFFGEIGILNLDGLNKRTADVRSVGYSELFSLSREDVLAAMKDYPEAQDILQTLGRKRLMEVRCVNKKYSKHVEKDTSNIHQNAHGLHESSMVEKFKNDVKGFRNVLKISRAQRKSEDYQDVQAHNVSPPKDVKSVLKRISRVRSEEKEEKSSEQDDKDEQHDKTPSPIGAGLPLLHRLRLLREKQDREERTVKSTAPAQKSPTHSNVTCTISPQESIREEPECETSDAIALITDVELIPKEEISNVSEVQSMVVKPIAKSNWRKLGGNGGGSNQNIINNRESKHSSESDGPKTSNFSKSHHAAKPCITSVDNTAKCKEFIATGTVKGISKYTPLLTRQKTNPSITKTLPESILSTQIMDAESVNSTPWSKLKLATLLSSSFTNIPKSSFYREDMPLKNYSLGNIPQTIAEEGSSSSKEVSQISMSFPKPFESPSHARKEKADPKRVNSVGRKVKKLYRSVFDLSPEYRGLPFVKRLKILNDRQRLAELEKSAQARSYSLDSPKIITELPLTNPLYRCYSDTSCIYSRLLTRNDSYSTITSTNTSVSECTQLRCSNTSIHPDNPYPSTYFPLGSEFIEAQENNNASPKLHTNKHLSSPLVSTGKITKKTQDYEAKGFIPKPKRGVNETSTLAGPKHNNYPSKINYLTMNEHSSEISTIDDKPTIKVPTVMLPKPTVEDKINKLKANKVGDFNGSNQPNSTYSMQGLPEAHEYFNQIRYGINSVIKTHMNEMNLRFKTQFSVMESEIESRDQIIAELERKLKHFEANNGTKTYGRRNEKRERLNKRLAEDINHGSRNNSSSDSSVDLLFMRGDSNFNVFNPVTRGVRECSSNYVSPDTGKNGNALASNFTQLTDNIILDIGDSSSTSSTPSASKENMNANRKVHIGKKMSTTDAKVHHNDWEVRMLAAEMEKQERKRGLSMSESITEFAEHECTDTDADDVFSVATRPRASSLDQYNLIRGSKIGRFSATSFKRDREKL